MKGTRIGEFEEVVLLAVGRLGDEASSVGIQELLEQEAGRPATLGAIYSALDRAERKRLVRSRLGRPQPHPGGRRRRLYRLTPKGVRELSQTREVRERLWRGIVRMRAS